MNNFATKNIRQRGASLIIFVMFFVAVSLSFVMAIGGTVYDGYVTHKAFMTGKQSFYAAEAGVEDMIHRLRDGDSLSNSESFTFQGLGVTTTRSIVNSVYTIESEGKSSNSVRHSEVVLELSSGVSFGFGLQSGNGGILMQNSSRVYGNVFSNGSVVSVSGPGNYVYGDIISAGASGLVNNINATGTAWAHTITDSTIDKDAYYQSITGTTVFGSSCTSNTHCHPGSTDQAIRTMPISDEVIEEMKTAAVAGGTIPLSSCSGGVSTGTYTISTNQTIGPIKVPCNLTMSGNNTVVTIAGPVWAVGNISVTNGANVRVSTGLADTSIPMIADNPSNKTTSSKIIIRNSSGFTGASGDSYMLMVSMNNSASLGGEEIALDVGNSTPINEREVIYYAPYGKLVGSNSLLMRGATAYTIELANTASIYYETGMADPLFSGTGGGFSISSWEEI